MKDEVSTMTHAPVPTKARFAHSVHASLCCGASVGNPADGYVCAVRRDVEHDEHEAGNGKGLVYRRAPNAGARIEDVMVPRYRHVLAADDGPHCGAPIDARGFAPGVRLTCTVRKDHAHPEHEARYGSDGPYLRAPNPPPRVAPRRPTDPAAGYERYRHGREGDLACGAFVVLEGAGDVVLVCTVLAGIEHAEHEASDGHDHVVARSPNLEQHLSLGRAAGGPQGGVLGALDVPLGPPYYMARRPAEAATRARPGSVAGRHGEILRAVAQTRDGRDALAWLLEVGQPQPLHGVELCPCHEPMGAGQRCALASRHRMPLHVAYDADGNVILIEAMEIDP